MPYSKTYVTQNTPEHKNLGIYNKCTLRVHVDVHLLSFIFYLFYPVMFYLLRSIYVS